MHIFTENYCEGVEWYKHIHKHGEQFQTSRHTSDLKAMLREVQTSSQKDPTRLLLDEQRFDLYTFDLDFCAIQKMRVTDIQTLVEEKLTYIKTHHKAGGERLFYMIDDITINGQPEEYILGQQGTIHAVLTFVFLQKHIVNLIKSIVGKQMQELKIYPQSFYTVSYLKKTIHKKHIQLLYIFDDYAKLITLDNGRYSGCEKINFGVSMLKKIYKENTIVPYFFKTSAEIELNEFAKNLVLQSVDFFAEILMRRLKWFVAQGQDLMIATSLVANTYFLDRFNQQYRKHVNGFIVPLHYTSDLHTFHRQWESDEIDVLTMLNFAG